MNLVEELKKEGREEGRDEGILEVGLRMLAGGVDEAIIMKFTGLSHEELHPKSDDE